MTNNLALGGFGLDGSVTNGTSMSGTFIYDSETVDQESGSANGVYAINSVSMTIGNYVFTHDPLSSESALFRVFTVDPVYSVETSALRFDGGLIYEDGIPQTYDDIDWKYTAMQVMDLWTSLSEYIPDDSLPDSFPDISVFDLRKEFGVSLFQQDPDDPFSHDGVIAIGGVITSLEVVPEPATLLLFGFGGVILRRRK